MNKICLYRRLALILSLAPFAGEAQAVVAMKTPFQCDVQNRDRRVSTVTGRALVGSGAYTVAINREEVNSEAKSPAVGTPVEIVRCLPPGRMVQLAVGKIARVENAHYLASVFVPSKVATADHTALTRSLVLNRNLYWQPMEGDYVRVLTPQVARRQRAWPRFEFKIGEIFETRPGDPSKNLSLKQGGRERLVNAFEQMETFQGRFLVESTSAEPGAPAEVRELTQIRAGLIANYLSRVFELPPERIVPRGLGRLTSPSGRLSTGPTSPGSDLWTGKVHLRVLPGQ